MSKFFTLLKASMSEGMNLFKFKTKNNNKVFNTILFAFLFLAILMTIFGYSDMMMEPLLGTGMEYSVITMFALLAAMIILVEGIYKASGLLFNCRDDDLILSLPVKKSSVFLLRMTKFYLFEVMFSAIILVPTLADYVIRMGGNVPATFYLVGAFGLILLPIIPVVIAVLFSMFISGIASRFRFKNLIQVVLMVALLIGAMALSLNINSIMAVIAEHASSINEVITRLYYPVGAFIQMLTDFNIVTLLVFILINVGVAAVFTWAFSHIYFKVNSRSKIVRVNKNHKTSKVKTSSPMAALMVKEARRFISSPVFLVNAGFSLILYVVAIIMLVANFDGIIGLVPAMGIEVTPEVVLAYIPAVMAGLIVFSALMTSITCSMISLEGRTINLLKSMPVSGFKIIMSKVLVAVAIMIPVFLIGDMVMFVRFSFDIWQILIILALSIVMPVVSEILGIIVNLKFPKMDAESDAEAVKQSTSSLVAVFMGMLLSAMTIYMLYSLISGGVNTTVAMLATLVTYILVMIGLIIYLKLKGEKTFNEIEA